MELFRSDFIEVGFKRSEIQFYRLSSKMSVIGQVGQDLWGGFFWWQVLTVNVCQHCSYRKFDPILLKLVLKEAQLNSTCYNIKVTY